jgi:hypothetical protein
MALAVMGGPIESEFIETFVVAEKRDRWLMKLESRHRLAELEVLNHPGSFPFVASLLKEILGSDDQKRDVIARALKIHNVLGPVSLVSRSARYDRSIIEAKELWSEKFIRPISTIFICLPRSLAFVVDDSDKLFILESK